MNALETQVGQIYIINKKLAKSFVCLLSEKLQGTGTEIYTLIEAPVINQTAWPDYEKTAKAVHAVLRKNMLTGNDNGFENSIAQINEDLSKLAEKGWAAWIGKMNACIAARQDDKLFLATTGKIHAYLFRDRQFSDIADAPKKTNPLKAFENFAAGKVAKKDFLFLTTNQLFNFISIERVRDTLTRSSLQKACESIAETVTQIADPEIAFGTFIIEVGGGDGSDQFKADFPVNASTTSEKYVTAAQTAAKNIAKTSLAATTTGFGKAFASAKTAVQKMTEPGAAKAGLEKIRNLNIKDFSPTLVAQKTKELANIERIKALPRIKKFFLASAIVFVVLLAVNIVVAIHSHAIKQKAQNITTAFSSVEQKISDANTAYIYQDKTKSAGLLNDAKTQLATVDTTGNDSAAKEKQTLGDEITSLINSINGLKTATATTITSDSQNDATAIRLIGSTVYFINSTGDKYTPVDVHTGKSNPEITVTASSAAVTIGTGGNDLSYLDSSGGLSIIDLNSKTAVLQHENYGTNPTVVQLYGSPAKAYVLNKSASQIYDALPTQTTAPAVYLKEKDNFAQAIDMAIDGSIYILYPDHVQKLTSGQSKAFTNANLTYSTNSKIYTDINLSYVYIMDPQAKRIILLSKSGAVKAQYTTDKFTNMKDFAISADGKTAYVLNGQDLISIPLN